MITLSKCPGDVWNRLKLEAPDTWQQDDNHQVRILIIAFLVQPDLSPFDRDVVQFSNWKMDKVLRNYSQS